MTEDQRAVRVALANIEDAMYSGDMAAACARMTLRLRRRTAGVPPNGHTCATRLRTLMPAPVSLAEARLKRSKVAEVRIRGHRAAVYTYGGPGSEPIFFAKRGDRWVMDRRWPGRSEKRRQLAGET